MIAAAVPAPGARFADALATDPFAAAADLRVRGLCVHRRRRARRRPADGRAANDVRGDARRVLHGVRVGGALRRLCRVPRHVLLPRAGLRRSERHVAQRLSSPHATVRASDGSAAPSAAVAAAALTAAAVSPAPALAAAAATAAAAAAASAASGGAAACASDHRARGARSL